MNQFPEPSGEPYDWRPTRAPERPYRHAYHQTLVDKIFCCRKPNPQTGAPAEVVCTFADALERIRGIDHLTRGIPKIMYLVGWQFDGHDSQYPSWSAVNERLKRPEDATAGDSLRWLMAEARRYHTTVSLHLNMNDAYENSPDWPEYERLGLIERPGGVWDGEQSYLINHTREWAAGLAQRRIDALLELLPLAEAGTVHIDAFWVVGPEQEAELATMRRIVRYWRDRGVDVTAEGLTGTDLDHGLVGLVPMIWHLNVALWNRDGELSAEQYLELPASLLCGGVDHSAAALLVGTSMQGEGIPTAELARYLPEFCRSTLLWHYLNHHQPEQLTHTAEGESVRFSGGLHTTVRDGRPEVRHGDVLLRDGDDVFVPAQWRNEPEIVAFSTAGYRRRRWRLPAAWQTQTGLTACEITLTGLGPPATVAVVGGAVELSVEAGQAVSLTPSSPWR